MWDRLSSHLKASEQKYLADNRWVMSSFQHCQKLNIDPDLSIVQDVMDDDSLSELLAKQSSIISIANEVFSEVHSLLLDKSCVLILTSPEARILEIFSGADIIYRCSLIGIRPGTSLAEESCGTNAVALALHYRESVAVKGMQHYCRVFHNWCSVAMPIFDDSNEVLGSICLSASHKLELGDRVALVRTLVGWLEYKLSVNNAYRFKTMQLPNLRKLGLSPRQNAILSLLLQGLTCKEIAAALNISSRTVESHLEKLRKKYHAKTTVHLVAILLKTAPARGWESSSPDETALEALPTNFTRGLVNYR